MQPGVFARSFAPVCITLMQGSSINGGVTIDGYNGFFLGFIRNHVNGSPTISNNVQAMDEIDIGSNVVNGSLTRAGNNPTENTGDSPGPTPDTVTGRIPATRSRRNPIFSAVLFRGDRRPGAGRSGSLIARGTDADCQHRSMPANECPSASAGVHGWRWRLSLTWSLGRLHICSAAQKRAVRSPGD